MSFTQVRFPPNIYYKIFTHRNIVDMCANSPKDYTRAPAKRLAAKEVHNRIGDSVQKGGGNVNKVVNKMGWYERIENNGWRLVSDRVSVIGLYKSSLGCLPRRLVAQVVHNIIGDNVQKGGGIKNGGGNVNKTR